MRCSDLCSLSVVVIVLSVAIDTHPVFDIDCFFVLYHTSEFAVGGTISYHPRLQQ